MPRVSIDILGISELKWIKMGDFESDDHYVYYSGKEALRKKWSSHHTQQRVWNIVLGGNLQNDRMISVYFQNQPVNIGVTQAYATNSNAK